MQYLARPHLDWLLLLLLLLLLVLVWHSHSPDRLLLLLLVILVLLLLLLSCIVCCCCCWHWLCSFSSCLQRHPAAGNTQQTMPCQHTHCTNVQQHGTKPHAADARVAITGQPQEQKQDACKGWCDAFAATSSISCQQPCCATHMLTGCNSCIAGLWQ
jgi:hypothetical protein